MYRLRCLLIDLLAGGICLWAPAVAWADPILEFSTYLGGQYGDQARTAVVDAQGYIYVAGNGTAAIVRGRPVLIDSVVSD